MCQRIVNELTYEMAKELRMSGAIRVLTLQSVQSVQHTKKLVRELLVPLSKFFPNELIKELSVFVLSLVFVPNRFIYKRDYTNFRGRSKYHLSLSGKELL